jgi:hypothetical protein
MARSIEDISIQIIGQLSAKGIIVDLTPSMTNIRLMWVYAIAFCINFHERIFDQFKLDVESKLRELKPHTPRWYAKTALDFQYGFPLIPETHLFDNTGRTDQEILESKVVKYSAVVEQVNQYGRTRLRMKLAGEVNGDLGQLGDAVMDAIRPYFNEHAKDAGVPMTIESLPPDGLKQKWRIFYDPLLLDVNGNRLDGSANDVGRKAIKDYLKVVIFNGLYARQLHTEYVKATEGVKLCSIDECLAQYGLQPYAAVDIEYLPDGGYMRFLDDSDLEIQYIPHSDALQ